MKHIIISTVILILSISFFFGILAFAEWDINPCYLDAGTRVVGAFMFFFAFIFWIAFMVNYLINNKDENRN